MEHIRAKQREKRKMFSKKHQPILERYNSFGILDLTPYEAIKNIRGFNDEQTRKTTSNNTNK